MQESEGQALRQARGKFAAMAGSYFMGNFIKNWGHHTARTAPLSKKIN